MKARIKPEWLTFWQDTYAKLNVPMLPLPESLSPGGNDSRSDDERKYMNYDPPLQPTYKFVLLITRYRSYTLTPIGIEEMTLAETYEEAHDLLPAYTLSSFDWKLEYRTVIIFERRNGTIRYAARTAAIFGGIDWVKDI